MVTVIRVISLILMELKRFVVPRTDVRYISPISGRSADALVRPPASLDRQFSDLTSHTMSLGLRTRPCLPEVFECLQSIRTPAIAELHRDIAAAAQHNSAQWLSMRPCEILVGRYSVVRSKVSRIVSKTRHPNHLSRRSASEARYVDSPHRNLGRWDLLAASSKYACMADPFKGDFLPANRALLTRLGTGFFTLRIVLRFPI